MSNKIRSVITTNAVLHLDEAQLRALDAIVGYGADPFLKVFYEHMGRAHLEKHEKGLRSLFDKIRREVPPELAKVDMARRFLADKARPREEEKKE